MQFQGQIIQKFVLPILATILFCVVGYWTVSPNLPHGASREEWVGFLTRFLRDFHSTKNDAVVTIVLLGLQILHTMACAPFINVTQTVVGFLYGWWQGGLVSGLWECAIIASFVLVVLQTQTRQTVPTQQDCFLQQFVFFLRRKRLIYPFILMAQMSSRAIPLNSTMLLIGSNTVSTLEFLSLHFTVSIFNAMKNTIIGHRIHHNTSKIEAWRIGEVMIAIVVLSTIFSLLLCCAVTLFYRTGYQVSLDPGDGDHGDAAYATSLVTPYSNTLVAIFRHQNSKPKSCAEELVVLIPPDDVALQSKVGENTNTGLPKSLPAGF